MNSFLVIFIGVLVGIVLVSLISNSDQEPRPIEVFCSDYFIGGSGFGGWHYYCPVGDTVREFACGNNKCYWLSDSGESDKQ